eukprot:gene24519-29825_t
MTIVEHDVLVDGRILGITAQGAQRFKVLRVLQVYNTFNLSPLMAPYVVTLGISCQSQKASVLPVASKMEPYAILEGTLVEDEEEDQDTVQQMEAELRPAFSKLLH